MLKITKDSLLSHPRGPAVLSNADLMVLSEDIYQGLNGDISCAVNEPELGHTSSLINVARKTALLSALWGAMGSDDWMQLPWDDRIISLLDDRYKVTLPKRTKVKDARYFRVNMSFSDLHLELLVVRSGTRQYMLTRLVSWHEDNDTSDQSANSHTDDDVVPIPNAQLRTVNLSGSPISDAMTLVPEGDSHNRLMATLGKLTRAKCEDLKVAGLVIWAGPYRYLYHPNVVSGKPEFWILNPALPVTPLNKIYVSDMTELASAQLQYDILTQINSRQHIQIPLMSGVMGTHNGQLFIMAPNNYQMCLNIIATLEGIAINGGTYLYRASQLSGPMASTARQYTYIVHDGVAYVVMGDSNDIYYQLTSLLNPPASNTSYHWPSAPIYHQPTQDFRRFHMTPESLQQMPNATYATPTSTAEQLAHTVTQAARGTVNPNQTIKAVIAELLNQL